MGKPNKKKNLSNIGHMLKSPFHFYLHYIYDLDFCPTFLFNYKKKLVNVVYPCQEFIVVRIFLVVIIFVT